METFRPAARKGSFGALPSGRIGREPLEPLLVHSSEIGAVCRRWLRALWGEYDLTGHFAPSSFFRSMTTTPATSSIAVVLLAGFRASFLRLMATSSRFSQLGSDPLGRFFRSNHRVNFKLYEIAPIRDPLFEKSSIRRLHDLITPRQVGRDPT